MIASRHFRLIAAGSILIAMLFQANGEAGQRPVRKSFPIYAPTLESPPKEAPAHLTYFPILQDKARKIEKRNINEGWAYVISGGIALGVSIPGYYLSEDVFARAVYSLGETLAVGAVGYGAYLILVSDDYARFVSILDSTPTLSPVEKERLAYGFLSENAKRARALRKIRVISHGLTAGLNVLNGATSDNRELRTALYFVGSINVLAALSFLFKASEEEKFLEEIQSKGKIEAFLGGSRGQLFGFQYRF